MALSAAARAAVAAEMEAAPHGDRTRTADRLAALYGVSRATVYRLADRRGASRRRAPERPDAREWVRAAVACAHRAPGGLSLDLAIRAAVEAGELPAEARDLPLGTAYRLAREMGLRPGRRRTQRMTADYPMQAVQIDASTSRYLTVAGREGDDHVLRLHRRPIDGSGYKNKSLGADRLRVVVYALWDMCTGYVRSRYCVARGESALDAAAFLCWSLSRSDDPRIPFHGVPDHLWSDQGPLCKSAVTRDLLDRLNVELVTGEAYQKDRMGGVERSHRTRWSRFERALFLRNRDDLPLTDLNARLAEFEIEENARRPSRTRVGRRAVSRAGAWTALTNARPADDRLHALPPNPMSTLAREGERRIDRNGHVRWGGALYEAEDWHDRWVLARQAVDGSGDLTLEDPATRERRPARRWRPTPYGVVRSIPPTALDRLLDGAPAPRPADLWAPPGEARPSNVRALPARSAPARPLDDPLDATRCRDADEAMRLFTGIWPHPLPAPLRAEIVRRIEAAGLDRRYVVDLAQHLIAATAAHGRSP